jgi:hypothetical protein
VETFQFEKTVHLSAVLRDFLHLQQRSPASLLQRCVAAGKALLHLSLQRCTASLCRRDVGEMQVKKFA